MLYIIRHGKTDWNLEYRLQGRTNIPLNDEGRKMATEAGIELRDIHFDVCYSSPLDRAFETARLLLEGRDVPIITDDRLIEMCFGVCEGTDNVFSKPDCPVYKLFKDPENYVACEGGESFSELYKRTGDFLNNVALPMVNEGKDVLIVGHGAMNTSIVCQVRDIPLKDFWSVGIPNCKIIKLM